MHKINKSFGANNVLTDVDFKLNSGEICALLGENGAGKSTLMNILGGVLPADSGTIEIDGKEVNFASPVDSLDAGIGFIHQELNLVNDLTIYENMFITHLPKKGLFLNTVAVFCDVREGSFMIEAGCIFKHGIHPFDHSGLRAVPVCSHRRTINLNRVDGEVTHSAPRRNRTCGVTAYGSLQSYMAYFIS